MNINPTIVVSAFNRPEPLSRLLRSLADAHYESDDINLIISIDKSDDTITHKIATEFDWKYGNKKIIQHPQHLGLKAHILSCGDLSLEYESVIILEDDLLVSPYFYSYSKKANEFYLMDENIAGISLYNYNVAESCFFPFKAIDDGTDVYFMQVACSWGQLWHKKQWLPFKNWLKLNPELPENQNIPDYLFLWGKHSWKKHFIHYLISTNKYFVFPRLSLTTNFEEKGTNSTNKNIFHVPIQLSEFSYKFQKMGNSKSIYDAWFEITPSSLNQFTNILQPYKYEVDLFGIKNIIENDKDYILTSKSGQNSVVDFGAELFPLETNIALNQLGNGIGLFEKSKNKFKSKKINLKNHLEKPDNTLNLSFSIIIPILKLQEEQLKVTIDSIAKQNHKWIELIIVSNGKEINALEKAVSHFPFNISIISSLDLKTFDSLVLRGAEHTNNEIITWVNQGSKFNSDSFFDVNSIFMTYKNINWIQGIYELHFDESMYLNLNVFKHRIIPSEVYTHLKSGMLNFSTEGHFFRRHCLNSKTLKVNSLKQLFFQLIENFQLIVVVKKIVELNSTVKLNILSQQEIIAFQNKYHHFKSKAPLYNKLLSFLIKLTFGKTNSLNWLYTSYLNFPPVLRFDQLNSTFYLHKN